MNFNSSREIRQNVIIIKLKGIKDYTKVAESSKFYSDSNDILFLLCHNYLIPKM